MTHCQCDHLQSVLIAAWYSVRLNLTLHRQLVAHVGELLLRVRVQLDDHDVVTMPTALAAQALPARAPSIRQLEHHVIVSMYELLTKPRKLVQGQELLALAVRGVEAPAVPLRVLP